MKQYLLKFIKYIKSLNVMKINKILISILTVTTTVLLLTNAVCITINTSQSKRINNAFTELTKDIKGYMQSLEQTDKLSYSEDSTYIQSKPQEQIIKALDNYSKVVKIESINAIDQNSLIANIITIIAISLSLTIVIPYIVGHVMAENKIRETIDNLYNSELAGIHNSISENVKNLNREEAHSSRMIAYLLLHTESSDDNVKYRNIQWCIGWAAKSIHKYAFINNNNYNTFIDDCIEYINTATEKIKNIDQSYINRDILVRAFKDLFIAMKVLNNNRNICNKLEKTIFIIVNRLEIDYNNTDDLDIYIDKITSLIRPNEIDKNYNITQCKEDCLNLLNKAKDKANQSINK